MRDRREEEEIGGEREKERVSERVRDIAVGIWKEEGKVSESAGEGEGEIEGEGEGEIESEIEGEGESEGIGVSEASV